MLVFVGVIILFIIQARKNASVQKLKLQELTGKHQKEIFKSVIATQEKERKRIANNLHDDIGTSLSAIRILVGQIKGSTEEDGNEVLERIVKNIDNTIDTTHEVINDLSPSSLNQFGLFLEINNLSKLISESTNIDIKIESTFYNERIHPDVELAIYRIVKEFINNSIKHADATEVDITIKLLANDLIISIRDNGKGFDPKLLNNNGHGHGLRNMESRVYLLNGKSELISQIGQGTRLEICIPLSKEDIISLRNNL
jgi:signal transduction histidine kinase